MTNRPIKNRAPYCKPAITAVTFNMERGFVISSGIPDPQELEQQLLMLGMEEGENDYRDMESFNVTWLDNENNGFF